MLKQERQSKQFSKSAAAAYSHLDNFIKSAKPEELHKYHVEIKKLKALLFLKKDFQERDDEAYLSVQSLKLFHVAGEIRQLDVNLKLLKKIDLIASDV